MTDLAAYFGRVGYTGPPAPTLETLQALVAAHNGAIPFENLDPVMGIPVADLGAGRARRQARAPASRWLLLRAERSDGICVGGVGFRGAAPRGRVVWMDTSGELPAQTHEALAVTVPGVDGPWLVDVGFGDRPCPRPSGWRRHRANHPARALPHSLRRRHLSPGGGDPRRMADAVHVHHPTAAADRPRSRKLVCLNISELVSLSGCRLRWLPTMPGGICVAAIWRFTAAANTERIRFATAADVLDALTERFGIDLTDLGDRVDVEARVSAVLDS